MLSAGAGLGLTLMEMPAYYDSGMNSSRVDAIRLCGLHGEVAKGGG
jgi:hypothetical protein